MAPESDPPHIDDPAARDPADDERTPIGVLLWFAWAFILLGLTGILLPKIVGFVDFSANAPFSILGIFMMGEIAVLIFGITVALQRKKIAWRFAVGIALLAAPVLAGLPPAVLYFDARAASGWYTLFVPVGVLISLVLVVGLLRPGARAYFNED
jgi:hypothetical protein